MNEGKNIVFGSIDSKKTIKSLENNLNYQMNQHMGSN